MKIWLFALLEAGIAALGLAAYFLAENVTLAGAAALLAAGLGIAQPIMAALQARKMARYQDGVYQDSLDSVDEQIQHLIEETIDPPPPHRATVAVVLQTNFAANAPALSAQYDRLIKAIETGSFAAEELAAAFADKMHHHSLGIYLCGLAAWSLGHVEDAHQHFTSATKQKPNWIAPWLGWASTAYRMQSFAEISERHPHVNSVELTPYDVGDEQSFIALAEPDRDTLVEQYQTAARSLGNYYTMAEFSKSKTQIAESREALRKAA